MTLRKAKSRRFFSRNGYTPYHGSDRRQAGRGPFVGFDRRRALAEPTVPLPAVPPRREPPRLVPVETPAEPPLSQAAIARRAEALYRASGCRPGRDLDNWLAAEAALRHEARQAALERHQRALAQWQKMLEDNGVSHAEAQDERLWLSRLWG